ncbi:MAG: DUF4861 family protein [Prevotella sp.]|nr:DUF4861 family protein [Prevotella sp.]
MKTLATIAAALMFLPFQASAAKSKKKQAPKPVPAIEIVQKVNDAYQATHSPEVRAFWDDAAYFTGNMEAYRLTGNARYLEYSDKWARHNKWSGATEKDQSKWLYKQYGESMQHVQFGDWQICFQTYLDMYRMNPDAYKIARAIEVMDYQVKNSATDYWWWADALYMVMPVYTKLYKVTGNEQYLDQLYANYKYADDLMWDKESHLYFRDGKYIYPAHKTDLGKKDFWARGDGWVLAGLAKVLADMPADYKHRPFFVERFQQLAEAVAACQQKEGYWTRSILDPEQAVGPETSGTAFFTYGLLWGMNHGLLDKAKYQPVTDLAWKYLTTVALQADGTVGYVQPIGEKAIKGQQLTAKNTANFGTGAMLLAACEKVRFDDASCAPAADAAPVTVTVGNPSGMQRQEVVELDAASVFQRLGISGGRQFVVKNALGFEVPYQLTYDGKLLIEACVAPKGQATYTITKGEPSVFVNTCYGRMYPERVDDIAWENDRGAYRCYGPALQRSGEDAFGNDVWVKNTPDLVVESRYHNELVNKLSYHVDRGYGLDCYKVGPTLGCGTPALIQGDNLVFPYCWKEYELLDNGPLRFTVRLKYNPSKYGNDDNVVENRILSIDKGSNFNKMTVWYDGLTAPADVASGVVIHTEDTESVVLGKNYVQYADPTDNPKGQNFQIYVAAIFPDGVDQTRKVMYQNPVRGNAGHALGIKRGIKSGEKFTYYFGSSWSKYDCRTQKEWQQRIDNFQSALGQKLEVGI